MDGPSKDIVHVSVQDLFVGLGEDQTLELCAHSCSFLEVIRIIYCDITVGSFDGDKFLNWLASLLEIMNPYPGPHSFLILDNFRIHHVEGVEEMCCGYIVDGGSDDVGNA